MKERKRKPELQKKEKKRKKEKVERERERERKREKKNIPFSFLPMHHLFHRPNLSSEIPPPFRTSNSGTSVFFEIKKKARKKIKKKKDRASKKKKRKKERKHTGLLNSSPNSRCVSEGVRMCERS